ncbi:MAG: aminotransferase class I/II-fold pyridoxal phosphate-dependent enzyme [Nitrospirota bacterium]
MNKSGFVSKVVQGIPPSGIRKFFDLTATMADVISLGVGEPDFVTPWHIRDSAIYSLTQGYTSYTSNAGLMELRQGISEQLSTDYGLKYSPQDEILITVGVSEGLDLALRAIINPGDEVIIPEPCYVSYKPCTIFAGGKPVVIPTNADTNFKITPKQVEEAITDRTKALLLSYPSNPTGATMSKEELMGIAEVVAKYDLLVVADEIYTRLTYDMPPVSFASLEGMKERTILLNGFSKAYAMTGWRIGYAAGPKEIIAAMTKIHQYTMLCASIISQRAALEALRHGKEQVEQMFNEYNQRRRVIVKGLNELGLDCRMPGGAFYVFPSIKTTGLTSEEFAEKLLFEEKVAVVPGTAFGNCGEGYIRCSYATSLEKIEEALERMGRFVGRLQIL